MKLASFLPLSALLLPVLFVGCGGGSSVAPPGQPTNAFVSIMPSEITVPPGGKLQFRAAIANASNQAVTWSVTGSGSVAAGLFSAPGGVETDTLTATSVADPSKSATARVTVAPISNAKIPFIDMTAADNYLGFPGGLYENSTDAVPADHSQAGLSILNQIQPRDASGNPSPSGKIVFMSIGMSHAFYEFGFFQNQIATDSRVNHTTLTVANGAQSGVTACFWTQTSGIPAGCDPPDPPPVCPTSDVNPYDIARDCVLTPAGLTEAQVQVAWFKQADKEPVPNGRVSLCPLSQSGCVDDDTTDALHLERLEGEILRAAHIRYPNLKQVFIASRSYGGYATIPLNPEPFAYESGFTVKWLIQAQINQERGAGPDPVAGDLSPAKTPWIAYGPYLWANGATPRSDGLIWCDGQFGPPCNGEEDYWLTDHTHPSPIGQQKVSDFLLNFYLSSPYTPWFRP